MDSGASSHILSTRSNLDLVSPYADNNHVFVGNGNSLHIFHVGRCNITPDFVLSDVLVVPQITKNLLLISKLADAGLVCYCLI